MDFRALGLGLTFAILWSSAFTSARIAVRDAPPFLILSFRFLIAGLLAIAIAWAIGQRAKLNRAQWISILLFGVLQNAIYLGMNFVAMQRVEAGLAAIIASLLPISVGAASWLLFREKLGRLGVAGLLAGLAGVLIIMTARLQGGVDGLGVVLCLIGLAALTGATLLMRATNSTGNILMVVGLQMLAGSAILFPLSLLFETWQVNFTLNLGLAFGYMILFPGLIATIIWFTLVNRIGATRAATFHFLNPFLGVLIASLLLGESVSLRDAIGVLIISAGILAVQISRRSARKKAGSDSTLGANPSVVQDNRRQT